MKCSICQSKILPDSFGWEKGHNAAPIINGRCCSSCNEYLVIPVRMWEAMNDKAFKPDGILKAINRLKEGGSNA
tara:strand:+ start:181 stop:402 length:222 start_codon:yes stop_codon:yes gene_type:complete